MNYNEVFHSIGLIDNTKIRESYIQAVVNLADKEYPDDTAQTILDLIHKDVLEILDGREV